MNMLRTVAKQRFTLGWAVGGFCGAGMGAAIYQLSGPWVVLVFQFLWAMVFLAWGALSVDKP